MTPLERQALRKQRRLDREELRNTKRLNRTDYKLNKLKKGQTAPYQRIIAIVALVTFVAVIGFSMYLMRIYESVAASTLPALLGSVAIAVWGTASSYGKKNVAENTEGGQAYEAAMFALQNEPIDETAEATGEIEDMS